MNIFVMLYFIVGFIVSVWIYIQDQKRPPLLRHDTLFERLAIVCIWPIIVLIDIEV